MTPLDPRQSVEFEPVSLGRRRHGFDPLLVGVLVAVVGLLVAVVKPWSVGATDPVAIAGMDVPSGADSSPAPQASPAPPIPAVAIASLPALDWSDVATIVGDHEAWGIRAIVRTPDLASTGASAYEERWTAADKPTGTPSRAVLQVGGRSVVALGVTYPAGSVPLDVRIWRRTTTGALRWLDARPLGRLATQGGLVFAPPAADLGAPTWGPGEYRVDVLVRDRVIRRFEVDIPDRYENIRPATTSAIAATELVAATQVDPTGVPVGPFATIDRRGVPLDGVGGAPLGEADAWLDTDVGSGRAPRHQVAVAYLPRATGLGIRLADGSSVRAAVLTRLAPGPFVGGPIRFGGGIIDHRNGDPWVVFASRGGEVWDPGTYRIDVTWADDAGLHDASWQIELRPGPPAGTPPLLAMARAWARHAGRVGLVVGRAEPLEGGPRSSAIRLLRIVDGTDAGIGGTCPGTIVGGSPEAFGLAYPTSDPLRVTSVSVPTVQSAAAVAGLTLIVPAGGGSFGPGTYRIGVEDAAGPRVVTVCVGGTGTDTVSG